MAGNENTSGSLAEDSLSTRLQWLRQRREALQEKLAQKNNELKNLCVEEAELTGVLPPEIPLEPGESPPVFRKRVGTAFSYPQNLINKLKTNEVEESALELERQVQIGIVEAALGIVNDSTESKAVRRKHRLVYQQSQRRLQELEARLNFLRQSRTKTHQSVQPQHTAVYNTQSHLYTNVKHRTKKPRPPLDNAANDLKGSRGLLQEGGISLSPLGSEDKCSPYPGHGYDDQSLVPNTCNHGHVGNAYCPTIADQRQNIKIIEHDHNDNQNIYILPDQYRARTYSHGSGGSRNQNHYQENERLYRPLPNTYTEEERQIRYRQIQQQQLHEQTHNYPQYNDYKHLDNDVQRRSGQEYYDRDFRTVHYTHMPEFPVYHKNNSQPQSLLRRDRDSGGSKNLRFTDSPSETQIPSGYWMRYEDEIVWCPDDQLVADRFGSLDRRKRNAVQHTANIGADVQPRYRTVSIGGSKTTSSCVPSHQTTSVHLLPLSEQTSTNNKMLLRTQSLGSVEKWHSNHLHELHDGKDTTDNVSRKGKEKEWYETSLDSGTSPGLDLGLLKSHKNIHYQSTIPACTKHSNASNSDDGKGNYMPSMNHRKTEIVAAELEQHLQPLASTRYEQTRKKVLEIPAESKSSQDPSDETIRLGSSQNCTIVQAGKYQPYREVTKPFEMSDFYKYSTKFRKRNEANGRNSSSEAQDDPRGAHYTGTNTDLHGESEATNTAHDGSAASSVQKRIYQPVQRMTCQPYLASLR
ncbi:FERM domain-containing protein 4A [Dufourea novaeangliae]|uniref:FERM domain-containing protein 4A n=2 Tax=Dufourea novaeangliae TaxID=178035 RepID=A0A154PIN4_DUFNO|nr:FERM domain-containing protein 4A [Dufourea novaeangliae]